MRVVVAGGSALVRDVLAGTFGAATDLAVLGVAASQDELLRECYAHVPDVLVTTTTLSDGNFVGVMAETLRIGVRVLVVCGTEDVEVAHDLLFAGASGYVSMDDSGPHDVVAAAREVAAGNAALNPAAAAAVLRLWREAREVDGGTGSTSSPVTDLSRRETEVLGGLARGSTTRAIGRELDVSPKTVEAHIARLFVKLGARNRAHAVSTARARGLLPGTFAGND